MLLDRAIRAYLQEAARAFAEVEKRDYAEANVKRDVLAVSRFIDFLFGEYRGKASRRPSSGDGHERRPRAE
jgi:hypothetical protein